MMPRRLWITIVCFHALALLSFAVGAAIIYWSLAYHKAGSLFYWSHADKVPVKVELLMLFGIFSIIASIGLWIITYWLRKQNYWAWIAGLVICGILIVGFYDTYLLSLIPGGLGLWGLVDPESLAAFIPSRNQSMPT